jgi:hypothetical protein
MTEELQALVQQRDEVTKKICTVKKTVAGLVSLFSPEMHSELPSVLGEKSVRQSGLSAECRLVLMSAERPLAAREVRDRVLKRLPGLANHRDSLASVTTILNRLIRYGEACQIADETGRNRWAWITEKPSASSFPDGVEDPEGSLDM